MPPKQPYPERRIVREGLMQTAMSALHKQTPSTAELLALAFSRPCFVCQRTGWCKHREPEVELAILGMKGIGIGES